MGAFAEEAEAARAFDDAARRLRGDKAGSVGAGLNFPTDAEMRSVVERVVRRLVDAAARS